MRIYFDLGYTCRCVADVTPAELETFTKVLDRARAVDGWWHGDTDMKLAEKPQQDYTVRVVPASVKLLAYVAPEETSNG